MPIMPKGRFIPVNMDRCQDLMGGGCSSMLHRSVVAHGNIHVSIFYTQIIFIV